MTIALHHVGLVVDDLEAALEFYCRAFGGSVMSREAITTVNSAAIGLPDETVQLRGAIVSFAADGGLLEIHEYIQPRGDAARRICDLGYGHIAFRVDDIASETLRLARHGMAFNSQPNTILFGDLAGRKWVYGKDPWGNVVELCELCDEN